MKIQLPQIVREFLAEILGTFLLVLFGKGAGVQVKGKSDNFLSLALGNGFSLMIGILASGGISGGHLNPAVTLGLVSIKKCHWKKIPIFWSAQYLGAFLASAVLFGTYADFINSNGGKEENAGLFATFPSNPDYSTWTLFMDQLLATALLLIIIVAVTDEKNMKVPKELLPLYCGLGLAAINLGFALNSGCAMNPAADFAPRLLSAMASFRQNGSNVFKAENYFFWIPWLVPHLGGVLGAILYTFIISTQHTIQAK